MKLILLERVEDLGQMGELVTVKNGYARNYLLPRKKALRATKSNIEMFEARKAQLEADNLKKRQEAEQVAVKMDGLTITMIRQASEAGQMYGSVSTRDIADAVTEAGYTIIKTQVKLNESFKMLGLFETKIFLHPEVGVLVTVNIARSEDEAAVQLKRGGALIMTNQDFEDEFEDEIEEVGEVAEATEEAEKKIEEKTEESEAA